MDMREMMTLIEAAMRVQGKVYWHGTDNVGGMKVMKEGLKTAGHVARKLGGKHIATAIDGVYFAEKFVDALNFSSFNKRTRYGWVFAVSSEKINSIEIDEDEMGKAIHLALQLDYNPRRTIEGLEAIQGPGRCAKDPKLRSELLDISKRYLTPEQIADLGKYRVVLLGNIAEIGMTMAQHVPDEIKVQMAQKGCHIAALHNVEPDAAYRYDPKAKSPSDGNMKVYLNNTANHRGVDAALAAMEKVR